ncbi:GBF-interacting protein 1-like [Asparagus officinalis]|uniref:GBF-interacting protein 1-like n=1 Tax=Asparagus officinalis TaxID=4686 RepID=UPI00098E437D|nr:GBF-interacting protein 1-like [Asparagus officinalis]
MSGSSSSRASIPSGLRKTIQNLKEIAKNHSDDEIYAMLRECSMDPNETAQKLLLQDPFHEVKRKREKKKETNKEPTDTKGRPASQARGGRGGRGSYSSHYTSHDAGGERNIGKENGAHLSTDKGITSSSLPPKDAESKSTIHVLSSETGLPNGPAKVGNPVPLQRSTSKDSNVSGTLSVKDSLGATLNGETGKPTKGDTKGSPSVRHVSTSTSHLSSPKQPCESGLYASTSDPVLVPSLDARITGNVGTIKHEVGGQRAHKVVSRDVSGSVLSSSTGKGSSEVNSSCVHEKMQAKSLGLEQPSDVSLTHSLSRTSSAGSRPSSNYSNRSHQLNGPQKAVGPTKEWKPKSTNVKPTKEWKPKSTNVKPAPAVGKLETTDIESAKQEVVARTLPASSSISLDESTTKLHNKLGELQFSDAKHVIIPNHLQVPESERTGLSFGSFDANFGLSTSFVNDTESERSSAELSETSQEIVEKAGVPASSNQSALPSVPDIEAIDLSHSPAKMPENVTCSADHPQSPEVMPESVTSREPESSSTVPMDQNQSKTEAASVPENSQYSVVNTSQTYSNFGPVPPMLGNQFATIDAAEPQLGDGTRIPSFLVQQPFDPATSYYTSMYRPTAADGDGRFSPFFAPATKYSGNVAVLPTHTSQTSQESVNSLALSSTGAAPLVTSGMMQNSLAVSQQSVPVFRQPSGVHLPHYPPNYLPYNQYFSPFYIPSPSLHPFLGNAAFPQQPPTGNIYPAAGAVGTAPVKYSISQYKPATSAANPSHMGMPTGYGAYAPGDVTTGSSTGTEDIASSQYKENNVYIAGQQSEGSVWIPTPGRDISAMQATSFYNLPTQGPPMAFPGIYHHPSQAIAAGTVHPMLQQSQPISGTVEMMGPPGGVYRQPQRTQVNWVNNY